MFKELFQFWKSVILQVFLKRYWSKMVDFLKIMAPNGIGFKVQVPQSQML